MNTKDTYKVTSYIDYEIAHINQETRYFRWYWQANICSFLLHHLFGYSCNTWKKKD